MIVAGDGDEALEALAREVVQPSLILLDWMMPRLNGAALIERLERDDFTCGIPVLIVSAIERAMAMRHPQVAALLLKPVRMRTLVDVVDRLCGMPRRAVVSGVVPEAYTVRLRRPIEP